MEGSNIPSHKIDVLLYTQKKKKKRRLVLFSYVTLIQKYKFGDRQDPHTAICIVYNITYTTND